MNNADISLEMVHTLLSNFSKNSYKAKDGDMTSTISLSAVMDKCINLIKRDYKVSVLNNGNGDLCAHYPASIPIIEYAQPFMNESNLRNVNVESIFDMNDLRSLVTKARFARCRSRFVVPVIQFEGKNICRSATISGGAEIYGRCGMEWMSGGEGSGSPPDAATSTDMQLFDKIRGNDIKLLHMFNIGLICDLMVENKKVKFGMNVTSSEKVDKEGRYLNFRLLSLPYPGCEFFKRWRDSNYVGSGLVFDWDQSFVDAQLDIPPQLLFHCHQLDGLVRSRQSRRKHLTPRNDDNFYEQSSTLTTDQDYFASSTSVDDTNLTPQLRRLGHVTSGSHNSGLNSRFATMPRLGFDGLGSPPSPKPRSATTFDSTKHASNTVPPSQTRWYGTSPSSTSHNDPLSSPIDWSGYRKWDLIELTQNYIALLLLHLKSSPDGLLVHCISGWDRTPLFISLLRLSLWADGLAHDSLSPKEILYLTLAYDWFLFGHNLPDRLSKGEEIMLFCFTFLTEISSPEYSMHSIGRERKPSIVDDGFVGVLIHADNSESSSSVNSVLSSTSSTASKRGASQQAASNGVYRKQPSPDFADVILSNVSQVSYKNLQPPLYQNDPFGPILAPQLSDPLQQSSTPTDLNALLIAQSSIYPVLTQKGRTIKMPDSRSTEILQSDGGQSSCGSWQVISSPPNDSSGSSDATGHSESRGQSFSVSNDACDVLSRRQQRLEQVHHLFTGIYDRAVSQSAAAQPARSSGHTRVHRSSGVGNLVSHFAEKMGLKSQPQQPVKPSRTYNLI